MSERRSFFRLGWRSNVALTSAVLATIAIQLATISLPALQPIFETHQLSPLELAVVLVSSTLVFIAVELEKRWRRHPSAEGHRRVAPAS
jgi:Ca2+-transporting ATPase